MRRIFVAVTTVMIATTVAAQSVAVNWMSDPEIKQAFSGVVIDGIYGDGRTFTETYQADARLSYTDHRGTRAGRWSVVNGTFCTLYDSMITGGCFKVIRHSGNCFEFYFLASSEVEAALDDPATRPSYTARGWDKSRPATCDDKPSA